MIHQDVHHPSVSTRSSERRLPGAGTLLTLSCAFAALTVCLAPSAASAQEDPSGVSLQADHFEPLPNQNHNLWNVVTSDTLGHLNWTTGVLFHYAEGLMIGEDLDGNEIRVIDNSAKIEPWFALGLLDVAEIGIVLPFAVAQSGDDLAIFNRGGETAEGPALGDLRLVLKAKLLDPEVASGFGIGFAAPVSFPTGDEVSYNSESDLRFEPKLSLDWRNEDLGLLFAVNAGLYLRETAQLLNYTRSSEFRWAFGFAAPLGLEGLQVLGDIFGSVGLEENVDPDNSSISTPIEALGGVRYNAPYGLHMSVAGGAGITDGVGAPEWRVLAAVGYAALEFDTDEDGISDDDDACIEDPEDIDGFQDEDGCPDTDNDEDGIADADDQCANEAEDKDGFQDEDGCPDNDNDQDGIADVDDQCIDEAEDMDGFQDEDGCPEDNDGDGIADADDQCPDEPEDIDGWQDKDGCPDPDNDGDGILDVDDQCATVAEDMDGFSDEDGCPDFDNDNDGLKDADDKCPDEAEVINGVDDEDGCPDEGKTLVVIKDNKIEILEKVFFETGKAKIKKQSNKVLDQVATVMRNNTRIKKVVVEGHTDDRGDDTLNMNLSQDRAQAVVDYLVTQGIEPNRLEAKGFGESKPIADNDTKPGRATNRRVEFSIAEMEADVE